MNQPDSVDLSLVSTADLMTELLGRADHAVVTLLHIITEKDARCDYRVLRQWKGNSLTCVGLAAAATDSILRDCNDSTASGETHDF